MSNFEIRTPSHDCLVEITAQVQQLIARSGIEQGLCTVYVPHTTAGITINENADPTVCTDMLKTLDRMVPWRNDYEHAEGNSAAHVKASLMGASCVVPGAGRPAAAGHLAGPLPGRI